MKKNKEIVEITRIPHERKLYQKCKVATSLIYLVILMFTIFTLQFAEVGVKSFFRIAFILISIFLLLITFLSTAKVGNYIKKWNYYIISFGIFLVVEGLFIMTQVIQTNKVSLANDKLTHLQPKQPCFIKLGNMNILDLTLTNLTLRMILIILPLLAGGLAIFAGIYGYKEAILVADLKTKVKEYK